MKISDSLKYKYLLSMNAVEIVEALNTKFKMMSCAEGVHFVLHKQIEPNSIIKAYKDFDYTLWYISKKGAYQVMGHKETARTVTEKEREYVISRMDKKLLMDIFSLFQDNNTIKTMLDGNFTGYGK